jgi:hypothetical protein
MTKADAVRYCLTEKARALQKFVEGVQPKRAPSIMARVEGCDAVIEKIKKGDLGKGAAFDLDDALATEQDQLYRPDVVAGPVDIEAQLKAILGPEA